MDAAPTVIPDEAVDEYDDVREDYGSEGSDEDDAWDVCAVPSLFTTPSTRRVFRVQRVGRVGGNHRPSFEYFGCVVEPTSRGADRALDTADTVVERDLTLCLRYEPPSPKFKQQCPHSASYRLKVSRGSEFLYSTRGMQSTLTCDRKALVAVWGNLELAFVEAAHLSGFLHALKYVEVVNAEVVDAAATPSAMTTPPAAPVLALPAPAVAPHRRVQRLLGVWRANAQRAWQRAPPGVRLVATGATALVCVAALRSRR